MSAFKDDGIAFDRETHGCVVHNLEALVRLVKWLRGWGYEVRYSTPEASLMPYDPDTNGVAKDITAMLPRILKCKRCLQYLGSPDGDPVPGDTCAKCGAALYVDVVQFTFWLDDERGDGGNFFAEVDSQSPKTHELFLRFPLTLLGGTGLIQADTAGEQLAPYAEFWTKIQRGDESLLVVNYNEVGGALPFEGAIRIVNSSKQPNFEWAYLLAGQEYLVDDQHSGISPVISITTNF